jgi:D-alanine-D-alanine ligase
VFVDDADVEYPIDKNDFSTTVNGNKISLIVCLTIHGTPGERPHASLF